MVQGKHTAGRGVAEGQTNKCPPGVAVGAKGKSECERVFLLCETYQDFKIFFFSPHFAPK